MNTVMTREEKAAVHRVLLLVNRILGHQITLERLNPDALVTDGRGLMTWRDLRRHVRAAAKLVKPC